MIYATLKAVHVLSIIVWIGGMVPSSERASGLVSRTLRPSGASCPGEWLVFS